MDPSYKAVGFNAGDTVETAHHVASREDLQTLFILASLLVIIGSAVWIIALVMAGIAGYQATP